MALTTDNIEKDLKKILNITSSARVDLGNSIEKESLPNGYHGSKVFTHRPDIAIECTSKDDCNNANNKDNGCKKQTRKDYFRLGRNKNNIPINNYNSQNNVDPNASNGRINVNPDASNGRMKSDLITNGFHKHDIQITDVESAGGSRGEPHLRDDQIDSRFKNKNRRGSEIWKRKRNKKDLNLISESDNNGMDQNVSIDAENASGISKSGKASKGGSREKTLNIQPGSKSEDAVQDVDQILDEPQGTEPLSNLPNGDGLWTLKNAKESLELLATSLVTSIYEEKGANHEDVAVRLNAFNRLKDIITSILPEAAIKLYGSTETGVILKCSDVNVDISTKQPKEHFKTLKAALESNHGDLFRNLELSHVTNSLVMTMEWCADGEPKFIFTIKANVENSIHTTQLLGLYSMMDARVSKLAVCLRVWAKVFQLDRQDEGTLPPHSFHIMVIHFMQRIQILPVLHELVRRDTKEEEDYNVNPMELEKLAMAHIKDFNPKQKSSDFSVGALWIKMLKFYDFYWFDKHAINIRKSEALLRNSLNWGSKNVAIEDPYCSRRNLARSMCHCTIYKFFRRQLESTRLTFSPQHFDPSMSTISRFKMMFFTEGAENVTPPPKMCTTCQNLGHVKQTCPEEIINHVLPLPTPREWVFKFIDTVLEDVLATNEQSGDEYRVKELTKDYIESLLRVIFPDKDPVLTLFGSSCNGFGFRKSDLDLSLSFKGQDKLEMTAYVQIINKLAEGLTTDDRFKEVIAITTAKVPIVKFCFKDFECDICLYNTLAQHNTRLLARYADLDRRARLLGYAVKHLAKVCYMCDASKGSLSSYAYTLMAIYFLQRTVPPVLPVLQELTNESTTRSANVVEGWDVWFDDANHNWKSENMQSPGQLWLEMIEFYSSYFDYENDVVCIRQKDRLSKSDKNWNGSGIAIEDPFNLEHNLGARLTNRMSTYIRKAFQKAMVTFASEDVMMDASACRSSRHFLFNKSRLTDGPPPNDRGCRKCFKLGHFIADCPKLQKKKQKVQPANEENQECPSTPGGSEHPKALEDEPKINKNTQMEGELRSSQPQKHTPQPHHSNNINKDKQQHVQRPMPPPVRTLVQSPQKRPLLQVPPNMMSLLPQCPQNQAPRHYFQGPQNFLLPPFQQYAPMQQVPMSMPGIQMRLPQTIPSLNTVFKRSDFQQPSHESHFHHPTHHHQQHVQQQQQHVQQQHVQQHQHVQQQHHGGLNAPKFT